MDNLNLATLAQLIARNLEGWTWEEPVNQNIRDSWQLLAGPGGAKLHLHYDQRTNRLSVGGEYPRDGGTIYPWNEKDRPDGISVSAQREPRAIAKDIERRYLPAFLVAFRKGVEMFAKARANEHGKKEFVEKLARLCGTGQLSNKFAFTHYLNSPLRFELRVEGPDGVRVQIDGLNSQQAQALLKFLLTL
jgi:hypothetical protein